MSIIEHVVVGFFLSRFFGGHHETPQHQQVEVSQVVFSDGCKDSQVQREFNGHAGRYPSLNRAVLSPIARLPVCRADEEWEEEDGFQSYDRLP